MSLHEVFPYQREWLRDIDVTLVETTAKWAEKEVVSKRLEFEEDRDKLLLPALRSLLVDIGLQGLVFPEAAGGSGLADPALAVTMAAVLEQVGAADVGLGFLAANQLAIQAAIGVRPYRNDALLTELAEHFDLLQPQVWSLALPGYGDGADASTGFHGLTAPARATAVDGGFLLRGEGIRPQIAGGDAALLAVVCATDDGEPALILVSGDAPGLERGEPFKTTGLAVSLDTEIALRDVRVTASHRVFAGADRLRRLLAWHHLGCAATTTGALLAGWRILKEWGETRVIKGKGQVFKENPLTASLMGRIGGRIGVARLLTYDLARLLAQPESDGAIYATAVNVVRTVTEMGMSALDNTMELMASAGYATEWQLERYWRDVKTLETRLGPATAARVDLARHYFDLQTL